MRHSKRASAQVVPIEIVTMTSLEIAELVGAEHRNVKRSIERLAESGAISLSPLEKVKIQRERRMETVSVYVFSGEKGKRDSIVVVAQLSPEFTARLVDRWIELEAKHGRKQSLEWQKAREEGKLSRKAETDVIEEFVEYATAQGSQNARHYYVNLTKGTYKALYLLDKSADIKDLRERLSVMQLNQLSTAESVARKAIAEYMDMGTHYKDIYRIAIDRVITLADLLGKQLPGNDNVRRIPGALKH